MPSVTSDDQSTRLLSGLITSVVVVYKSKRSTTTTVFSSGLFSTLYMVNTAVALLLIIRL